MSNIKAMLELQDRMNTKVDPDWKTNKNPFLRAVAVEGGEALEHWGWKWWKAQTADMPQFKIELVDIWHFILSEAILQYGPLAEEQLKNRMHNDTYVDWAFNGQMQSIDLYHGSIKPQERIDALIGFAALRAPVAMVASIFRAILERDARMSLDELYTGYLAKNVLNFFRQDNGYKQGTYLKEWFGEEDNVWLDRFCKQLGDDITEKSLYKELQNKYEDYVDYCTRNTDEDDKDVEVADDELTRKAYNEAMGAKESMRDDPAPDNTYALKP